MFDLAAIQEALADFHLDAWFMADFRGSNILAHRVLDIAPELMTSRRFAYCIPREGQPKKLVHRIEQGALDHLPGESIVYLKWQEWEAGVAELLGEADRMAVEYSPRNGNPYLSRLDAGTIELIRDARPGVELVPSGDLIQLFEATWTPEQWDLHQQASKATNAAFERAWSFLVSEVRSKGEVEEVAVLDQILQHFREHNLVTHHNPIVGVGPNAGDPHYETGQGENTTIREGDLVLIDLWGKIDHPDGVYSDLTRMGFVGTTVPEQYADAFGIIRDARDAAIDLAKQRLSAGEELRGWELDEACRAVIEQAGFGHAFVHRTGHSIGRETHGNGANIDNLESRDDRRILPRTCFSIEPGIYLPEFGVRTEVDVYIDENNGVHITGGEEQTEVYPLLEKY